MITLLHISGMLKPVINLADAFIALGLSLFALYSLTRRYDIVVLLFTAQGLLGTIDATIWFFFTLQTEWKITLLPLEVRQACGLFVDLTYPLLILIGSTAFYLLVRRNIPSPPPLPQNSKET